MRSAVLAQDVRIGQRVVGPQRRILDEWRVRGQRTGNGEDGDQLLVVDLDQLGGRLGGVFRFRRDRRNRVALVLGLADRDDRPIGELRAEARHRLR